MAGQFIVGADAQRLECVLPFLESPCPNSGDLAIRVLGFGFQGRTGKTRKGKLVVASIHHNQIDEAEIVALQDDYL